MSNHWFVRYIGGGLLVVFLCTLTVYLVARFM